jgi:glycosyltransferase involved in cell wall biosynthesis
VVPLLAQPHVEMVGEVGEEDKGPFLAGAHALLFPVDWPEPFGLVMIEALACGTPVIALRRGGAAETVTGLDSEEPSGVFFEEQSAAAVVAAVGAFEASSGRITAAACRRRAEQFSAARFRSEFTAYVARASAEWRQFLCGAGARSSSS